MTHQPRAYMQMLMREGRFRLLKSALSKDVRIWHNCDDYGDEELVKHRTIYECRYGAWRSFDSSPDEQGWRCTMCNALSPEGLTGAYIMLDWDRSTNEIADASEPDPWADSLRGMPF
ncbi:hypothetical protein LCGC14_0209500 [marine sediment metagenome]|uniref:Uncharacterized protein n=1 Tax=marine sediment metagenome TaxID=412755 RepID=A0A0F9ULF5_9ZZZZ